MAPFKKKSFRFILLLTGLSCATLLAAQVKKTDSTKEDSYFKLSGSYLSNLVYNGRKDSLQTPYITPSLGYYDKSGFYISGSLSYLASSAGSHIDLVSLDAGYDFDITDKLSGTVYANKSFYNKASTAIKSDITASLGTGVTYDFDLLQLTGGADLLFAQKADIAVDLGVAHAFYFGEHGKSFSIAPSFTVNMSTLHFYEGYTNRKLGKNVLKANPNAASATSTTTVNGGSKFTLLNYELSLPFTYDAKKFGFFFTPSFALPQNPIYTTTTTLVKFRNGTQNEVIQDSTPSSEKKIGNTFYLELGIYVKL